MLSSIFCLKTESLTKDDRRTLKVTKILLLIFSLPSIKIIIIIIYFISWALFGSIILGYILQRLFHLNNDCMYSSKDVIQWTKQVNKLECGEIGGAAN